MKSDKVVLALVVIMILVLVVIFIRMYIQVDSKILKSALIESSKMYVTSEQSIINRTGNILKYEYYKSQFPTVNDSKAYLDFLLFGEKDTILVQLIYCKTGENWMVDDYNLKELYKSD